MFIKVVSVLLACLLVCDASKVLEVSDKFLAVRKEGMWLMKFYAPWCGHCKRMKPDFQSAAAELKGQAVLAAMDVNKAENSAVSRKYNITGFPTLLFFDGGELQYPYPGGNNKEVLLPRQNCAI